MDLITSEQRDILIRTFERDAFHLELQDEYHVAEEAELLAKWRRGEPDDDSGPREPWLNRMREAVRAGKTVRRVRVVTEPVTDYIRWEHAGTWRNQDAGEDIRWLPRHRLPAGTVLPVGGRDWWLFDDRILTVTHFHEDGRHKGSELITDPTIIAACVHVRDRLWAIAIPHDKYRPF